MSTQKQQTASLTTENIGGIAETSVEFSPGVTILEGENATNRTSLLQAIMASLGSNNVSMKGNADEAYSQLKVEGNSYSRELTRKGSTFQFDGDPYLEDATLADLFAFLLGSNEARRAVHNYENLRDLIVRPIDTDEIQREINRLLEERRDLEAELEEVDTLKDQLPVLEERRATIREEIEETKADLEAKEEELQTRDTDVEETREEQAKLEERLDELREKRADLEDIRYDLETERETLDELQAEKREVSRELEELPDTPTDEIEDFELEIDRLREQKRELESEVNEIQSVIGFNQQMLAETDSDVLAALEEAPEEVTEELLPDESVTCWTCGSEVPEDQIETTLDRLQDLSQDKLSEVNTVETRIEEVTDDVQDRRETKQRRETLQQRIDETEAEIDRCNAAIERLTNRREELETEIEEMEADIEEMEDDAYEEILSLHKEANQLEYELGRMEGELDDVQEEITAIEERLDSEDELKAQREAVNDEIEVLRTKIERIETDAIEAFNDHMDEVLDVLEYRNLERIWLERIGSATQESPGGDGSVFELHIVRESGGGATYEDTIDHLSESEREVTGLVFALAGYLAYDVYETVPFMLLDSLEAIDADRIGKLIEYIAGYSEYLVVALLPEAAAVVDEDYEYLTDF